MEALVKYNLTAAENLLAEIKRLFMSKGIMLAKKFSGEQDTSSEEVDRTLWIKPFVIQTSAPAFYLDINSPDDLAIKNADLESRINDLQGKLKTFLQNNSDLDENLAGKINTLATSVLMQAKRAVKFGLKKSLGAENKNCNTIEELQEAAGRRYGDFLRKEFLERIMIPLYEGLQQTPNEGAYLYVLGEANNFLADLGVATVNISVGEKYDENLPYVHVGEADSPQYVTTNGAEKDTIREILRYAYAFQEDKGAENRLIMEGEVIVMLYRPGGAQ